MYMYICIYLYIFWNLWYSQSKEKENVIRQTRNKKRRDRKERCIIASIEKSRREKEENGAEWKIFMREQQGDRETER